MKPKTSPTTVICGFCQQSCTIEDDTPPIGWMMLHHDDDGPTCPDCIEKFTAIRMDDDRNPM